MPTGNETNLPALLEKFLTFKAAEGERLAALEAAQAQQASAQTEFNIAHNLTLGVKQTLINAINGV